MQETGQEMNCEDLLIKAITRFYRKDAKALFLKDRDIDERAMVGCIYRYVWCQIRAQQSYYNVDIEYDTMRGRNGSFVRKSIDIAKECGDLSCRKQCLELIASKVGKKVRGEDKVYSIRPDLIIHKRNSDQNRDNLLVAEFKKSTAKKAAKEFDRAKVRWCTCPNSLLQYSSGIVVDLGADGATVERCRQDGRFERIGVVGSNGLIKCGKVAGHER